MVPLGSVHSRYLEGSFPAGGELQSPLGMVYAMGLSPDPGIPSVFDAGALVSGSDHFCIHLSVARTHGGPEGPPEGRHAPAP
jgi:hypothetical protein